MKEITYRILNSAFVATAYWWFHNSTMLLFDFVFQHLECMLLTFAGFVHPDGTVATKIVTEIGAYVSLGNRHYHTITSFDVAQVNEWSILPRSEPL